jgi:hypothetical protein
MDGVLSEPALRETNSRTRNSSCRAHNVLSEPLSNSKPSNMNSKEVIEERSFPSPCSSTPHDEYKNAINLYYSSERDLAKLYQCADMRELAYERAASVVGVHLATLISSLCQAQFEVRKTPDDLINSAVKLVCGAGHPNLSLLRTFPADIRKWLLLEGTQVAVVGSPEEISCTALCGKLSGEMHAELRKCAEECRDGLRRGVGYEDAFRPRSRLKQAPTYRRVLEQDALCVHMQCIEVLVGPDALTVCKKIAKLEDVRRTEGLLKGIVLTEECASCQLVVQLALLRGTVITRPVTEPRHIAAYLVLALQYSGEELLWVLDQWHRLQTGQPLPRGVFSGVTVLPELFYPASENAGGEVEPHEIGSDDSEDSEVSEDSETQRQGEDEYTYSTSGSGEDDDSASSDEGGD